MSTLDELRVTCLTGAGQTGANAYLVSLGEWSMLLDAGASTAAHASWLERLEKTPDLVWLSHVHADHIGALTELRKRSSALQILMTPASKRLLPAALRYQDRRRVDTTGKTLAHLVTSLGMHHTHSIAIDAQTRAHLTAYPCGHMLGAASLYLEIERAEKFQRIFYLPDFSAHALPMTPRAAFPPYDENKRLDLLLMEGMLGTDKPSDKADFDANLAALVSQVTAHPCEGGQLFALAALGESCELAFALTGGEDGAKIIVHDYLRPIFAAYQEELFEQGTSWQDRGIRFATQKECTSLLRAGRCVIAPGEHLDKGTPARQLAMSICEDPKARIVLLNSVRRKSFAGTLLERFEASGEGAEVVHARLPFHAPRWSLKGVMKALKPGHTWLIHGQKGSLLGLAKALRVQQKGRAWASTIEVPGSGDQWCPA